MVVVRSLKGLGARNLQTTSAAVCLAFALARYLVGAASPAGAQPAATNGHHSTVEVAFCDSQGRGFMQQQPNDQLERWQLPYSNGTHLVVNWLPHAKLCGRNVSSYHVDVSTSMPVVNFFVGLFGKFPQDMCAPGGSKARDAVNVDDDHSGGARSTCSPYERWCASRVRETSFEIPRALLQVLQWDVEVTVRAYGSHSPVNGGRDVPAQWWCHKYRNRPRSALAA